MTKTPRPAVIVKPVGGDLPKAHWLAQYEKGINDLRASIVNLIVPHPNDDSLVASVNDRLSRIVAEMDAIVDDLMSPP